MISLGRASLEDIPPIRHPIVLSNLFFLGVNIPFNTNYNMQSGFWMFIILYYKSFISILDRTQISTLEKIVSSPPFSDLLSQSSLDRKLSI